MGFLANMGRGRCGRDVHRVLALGRELDVTLALGNLVGPAPKLVYFGVGIATVAMTTRLLAAPLHKVPRMVGAFRANRT